MTTDKQTGEWAMNYEREDYMRRQEADHDLLRMRTRWSSRRAEPCRVCNGTGFASCMPMNGRLCDECRGTKERPQ